MRAILRTLANAMLTFMFVNGIQSILLTEGLLESSSNFEMCHCTYKTLLTVPLYPISQLGTKNSVTVRNRLLYCQRARSATLVNKSHLWCDLAQRAVYRPQRHGNKGS